MVSWWSGGIAGSSCFGPGYWKTEPHKAGLCIGWWFPVVVRSKGAVRSFQGARVTPYGWRMGMLQPHRTKKGHSHVSHVSFVRDMLAADVNTISTHLGVSTNSPNYYTLGFDHAQAGLLTLRTTYKCWAFTASRSPTSTWCWFTSPLPLSQSA